MNRFENKIGLVTGGGTGIGRAVAEAIVSEGGNVVVASRRAEPLRSLAAEHPDRIRYITADVARASDCKNAVAFAIEHFARLDVLVNNAAAFSMKPLSEMDSSEIAAMTEANINGVLYMIREALPHLIETSGSIVNVTSVMADASLPGTAVYSGTKAAQQQITRSLAVELGPQGVRVNAVAPGFTETDMIAGLPQEIRAASISGTPLGRIGKPEDIAKAVLFLASEDASWITGQVLQSSGGNML